MMPPNSGPPTHPCTPTSHIPSIKGILTHDCLYRLSLPQCQGYQGVAPTSLLAVQSPYFSSALSRVSIGFAQLLPPCMSQLPWVALSTWYSYTYMWNQLISQYILSTVRSFNESMFFDHLQELSCRWRMAMVRLSTSQRRSSHITSCHRSTPYVSRK